MTRVGSSKIRRSAVSYHNSSEETKKYDILSPDGCQACMCAADEKRESGLLAAACSVFLDAHRPQLWSGVPDAEPCDALSRSIR